MTERDPEQAEYAEAANRPEPGPLAVEADTIIERLATAVMVMTVDANGNSHLIRAGMVTVGGAANMLRNVAGQLEAEEQAGEHQHP